MFQVEIGGKKLDASVTFYTSVLYEMEFCKDIIQDFFGVQGFEGPIDADGDNIVSIDFTKINWSAASRVLWAALKTADDSTPGYSAWAKGVSGLNMWLVREQLADEVADCFFRAEAAGEDQE